jgi:hypothetical protein
MEPSRQTAGRRRRALLALSRELDQTLGPDRSHLVHTLDDGWSIRRPRRTADQRREGALMRNCLVDTPRPDNHVWSLRDPENLPHVTFTVWRIAPTDRHAHALSRTALLKEHMLLSPRLLFAVDTGRQLKPTHRQRLLTFAADVDARRVPSFPHSLKAALTQMYGPNTRERTPFALIEGSLLDTSRTRGHTTRRSSR